MTGTVGAVAVTAGPGLTNTVTAIKNAQMAESPILLIGAKQKNISYSSLKMTQIVSARWSCCFNPERTRSITGH
jgi:thiamine pyrophosphate-dependent acetolactate synthase large subunit-like protein